MEKPDRQVGRRRLAQMTTTVLIEIKNLTTLACYRYGYQIRPGTSENVSEVPGKYQVPGTTQSQCDMTKLPGRIQLSYHHTCDTNWSTMSFKSPRIA